MPFVGSASLRVTGSLAFALLGGCGAPCADGYGHDDAGNCVHLANGGSATGSVSPGEPDPTTDPADSADTGADTGTTLLEDPWFTPIEGAPNVLYFALDAQRADALMRHWGELPDWFTDVGVDFPLLYTPSSHTSESAPWMLTGCDLRDGPSQHQSSDLDPTPIVTTPAGCETMGAVYGERGYDTLLISGNYAFVNGTWYDADDVRESTVGTLDWGQEVTEAIDGMSAPWAATYWVQGARLPFPSPSNDPDCDSAPLGYDLTSMQTLRELDNTYGDLSADELTALREAMACNYDALSLEIARSVASALESLEAAGHLDNAAVVFTTDHGELLLDYTDGSYPEGYAEPHHWVEHGNRLLGYETAGFGKVWFSDASELATVERVSGSPDLLATLYHLTGVDPAGLRGATPWSASRPVVQAKDEGQYELGAAWTDAASGIPYRYTVHQDGSNARLYDLQADPGEREDLLARGATLPQEIDELVSGLQDQYRGQP